MKDVPEDWKQYLSAQEQLAKSTRADKSWGLEAKLNALLDGPRPMERKDLERVAATAERRERYQSRLRLIEGSGPEENSPYEALEAREGLRLVFDSTSDDEKELLTALADGQTYSEIAEEREATVASLRVRVMRLRRRLAAAA